MVGDGRPIGVFDSDMGGLTVLRALAARLPNERFVYLGDTARLPYGTKSAEIVQAYALQATRLLLGADVKMVVIACNTASAVALAILQDTLAPIAVIGVIEPGARAGVAATRNKTIAVLATESTVKGGAYARAIRELMADAAVVQKACQAFVALAEEGWAEAPATLAAADHYLDPLFSGDNPPDTLVFGCTHFPVLANANRRKIGGEIALVDSAQTTAGRWLRRCSSVPSAQTGRAKGPRSGSSQRIRRNGSHGSAQSSWAAISTKTTSSSWICISLRLFAVGSNPATKRSRRQSPRWSRST